MTDKSSKRNGRPPDQRERVVSALRTGIVSGRLKPGDRLPTHHELEERFQAGPPTIQDAMAVLREAGFIETKHRSGTFVAAHPPHLSHFALAFPAADVQSSSRFFQALCNEADKLQSIDRHISAFYGIESHVDVPDYQRLLELVQQQRLAGLIFGNNPYQLAGFKSPLLLDKGVRRVGIMLPDRKFPFPTVYPDIADFIPKAFDYLAARGRKRVAVVMLGSQAGNSMGVVESLAAERGLVIKPHWLQAAFQGAADWARRTALLLFNEGQRERPDAVVITDDNLVEGFSEGIRDSGIRVFADNETASIPGLEVVAQANFPYPTRCHVPAKRLGYNITKLLEVCLTRIDQQRRGEKVPSHTAIPAEFLL